MKKTLQPKRWISTTVVALTFVSATLVAGTANAADATNAVTIAQGLLTRTLQQQIDAAQQRLMQELSDKANTLASGIKDKLNSVVGDKLGEITGGPVGKLMQNAGISMNHVAGANVAGHVDPDKTKKQMQDLGKVKNPVDAITEQTKIMLANQLHDRLNVTSMLDEKPVTGNCTTAPGDKCTILTALRELDAVALNDLQRQNIAAVGLQISTGGGTWANNLLRSVYSKAGTDIRNPESYKLVEFLTPSHSIPIGFERSSSAANLDKSMWLANAIIGSKNDVQFLTAGLSNKDEKQQVDAMSKVAKIQLARSAIMNVHNQSLHTSLNAQFRACVVRPDAQDRIGATQEQQLVHVQSLIRCNNMILLQSRQQELESQRLMGAMLLTLLDLYAVQQPSK